MDAEFVRPLAASTHGPKMGVYIPWTDGVVAFGNEAYPDPTFIPDGDALVNIRPAYTIEDMLERARSGKISLAMRETKAGGKVDPKNPPGTKRYFLNDVGIPHGNLMTYEGNLLGDIEQQPYLALKPNRHEKCVEGMPGWNSFGALVIVKDPKHVEGYRGFSNWIVEQVVAQNVFPPIGKKRPSHEMAMALAINNLALPGMNRHNDEAGDDDVPQEAFSVGSTDDIGGAQAAAAPRNFGLFQKQQMEPPGGFKELQTRFYEFSDPKEPFTATPVTGYDTNAGRRLGSYYEWSELKKDGDTKARMVHYMKHAFYAKPTAGATTDSVVWGGASVALEAVDSGSNKRVRVENAEE